MKFPAFSYTKHFKTILSWEWAEVSMEKSAKFQMTIHIDYDREENKNELFLDSQGNVIRTLVTSWAGYGFFKTIYQHYSCLRHFVQNLLLP